MNPSSRCPWTRLAIALSETDSCSVPRRTATLEVGSQLREGDGIQIQAQSVSVDSQTISEGCTQRESVSVLSILLESGNQKTKSNTPFPVYRYSCNACDRIFLNEQTILTHLVTVSCSSEACSADLRTCFMSSSLQECRNGDYTIRR